MTAPAITFAAPVVRCARGAWGNRTHSAYGTVTIKGESLDWSAFRDFDRKAATGSRVSFDILLQRNGRELTGARWDDLKREIRAAFRSAIEAQLTEADAAAARDTRNAAQTDAAEAVAVMVRRDNVEYHAGRKAFADGTACPYSAEGERATRWNLGHSEAAAERQAELLAQGGAVMVRTIDCTPTWSAILPALVAALQDGTAQGQQIAREELARMAGLADERNRMARQLHAIGEAADSCAADLTALASTRGLNSVPAIERRDTFRAAVGEALA